MSSCFGCTTLSKNTQKLTVVFFSFCQVNHYSKNLYLHLSFRGTSTVLQIEFCSEKKRNLVQLSLK